MGGYFYSGTKFATTIISLDEPLIEERFPSSPPPTQVKERDAAHKTEFNVKKLGVRVKVIKIYVAQGQVIKRHVEQGE